MTSVWHPFSDMARVKNREFVLERGDGVWVYGEDGRRYLDATAALWYCSVGHGRRRLANAAADQMTRLAAYQIFDDVSNRPADELATRLCELAGPRPHGAVFFTSGGSDSVETGAKIARRYWRLRGESDRTLIIAREGAYHGMHAYGTSLAGIEPNAVGWGPLVPDVVHVPRDDLNALESSLIAGRDRVAAVIGEPVQGAAGVHPPPPAYWEGVQDLCRQQDVLLILDEVVTGFGRLGTWFAKDRFGIEPDLLLVAKGLSSGYAPIGAVIASERVTDVLWSAEAGAFRHGYTYSGHPTACAVALENLRIIEDEGLVERVRALEGEFAERLSSLASHGLVAEVRTAGLLAGVELSEGAVREGLLETVVSQARSRGVLTRGLIGRTLQISPAFVVETADLDFLVERLDSALDAAAQGLSVNAAGV